MAPGNQLFWAFFVASMIAVGCASNGDIWPQPQTLNQPDKTFMTIESPAKFKIHSNLEHCELLDKAIARYTERMFIQDCSLLDASFKGKSFNQFEAPLTIKNGPLDNLTIEIEGKCEQFPYMKMDESYEIGVEASSQGKITAKSVWGALRALETFSQMLVNTGLNQFAVRVGNITDFPRFSHRGLMIDTSRHFLPMRIIYETLNAMEMNKLNVLHWHIVDDQAFPFVSETFPELSIRGAYNSKTHVYSVADVSNVIEYARLRGIRVLNEFDTPGHTLSWGKAVPGLLTECYHNNVKNGQHGPMDPTKNSTFQFVEKLFKEIVHRFPDQYVHLGGDEVYFGCWQSSPEIKQFMQKLKFGTDYSKLEEYYIQRLLEIVQKLKRSYIVWQEVFDNKVHIQPDTVVHVWKGHWENEMKAVTSAGYHALLSSCWYLNRIRYGSDWPDIYKCEPTNFNATAKQESLVLGGEACVWSEFVDGSNLISRTWPRAIAVAERLWSPKSLTNPDTARPRFRKQHCRMQRLGIHVEPIDGPGYCQCDHAM